MRKFLKLLSLIMACVMLTACGNAAATTAVTTDAPAPDPIFGKIKFLVYNGSTEVLNDRPANKAEFTEFLNIYRTENNQFSNIVYNGGIYYIEIECEPDSAEHIWTPYDFTSLKIDGAGTWTISMGKGERTNCVINISYDGLDIDALLKLAENDGVNNIWFYLGYVTYPT